MLTVGKGSPGSDGKLSESDGTGTLGSFRLRLIPGILTCGNGKPGSEGSDSESAGIGSPGSENWQLLKARRSPDA